MKLLARGRKLERSENETPKLKLFDILCQEGEDRRERKDRDKKRGVRVGTRGGRQSKLVKESLRN